MNRLQIATALIAAVWAPAGCGRGSAGSAKSDSTVMAERAASLDSALARADTGSARGKPIAKWVMGNRLQEISGLALTADGRLLTHGDERGRVVEIDYRRGVVVKQFSVGEPALKADFEGITVVGDAVVLLASNGKLYQFDEGADGEHVDYTIRDPHLSHICEFEGVAYDPTLKALLLACKNVYKKSLEGFLVIFRLPVEKGAAPLPELKIPLDSVIGTNQWKDLRPSDITVDPVSGNYVLVASREAAIIEITPTGGIVFARPLPGKHFQAEGVAITKDSILMVSDEAVGSHPAAITLYRWP
ncbi:MAG: hypothetical protein ABI647_21820 [Gemmatimonadota bacterium]